jgi:hypothetical protein
MRCSLGQLRMGWTVRQQRIRHEIGFGDRRVADLTGPVGTDAQAFQPAVHVVQRGLSRADTLIAEIGHAAKILGPHATVSHHDVETFGNAD